MSVVVKNAKEQIKNIIFTAASKAIADGALENAELRDFTIEVPKDRANGDYAINAAMVWSRLFKKAPRQIAEILMANASFEGTYIEKYEIAGPGFINFYLSQKYYADIVLDVEDKKEAYGRSNFGVWKIRKRKKQEQSIYILMLWMVLLFPISHLVLI